MKSIGEALVDMLESRGVEFVFGIPGVHTIELYRGLAGARIRHITPRHEQGAGFMADGYARVSGKPGVAFVITGPGLTNILTPMAQARADSVPMLVISGVNARDSLGRGLGRLHELADQQKMAAAVALASIQIGRPQALAPALTRAFTVFSNQRGGPIHLEIPVDVMGLPSVPDEPLAAAAAARPPQIDAQIKNAADILLAAKTPLILAGGGARHAGAELAKLAIRLDAPVIETVNARGLLHGHALCVPASPSLSAVRGLIAGSDAIIALGTELGPTDYDMNRDDGLPDMARMIRIDLCNEQLARHPAALKIHARADQAAAALLQALGPGQSRNNGKSRASTTRMEAKVEIGETMRAHLELLETLRTFIPNAIMVGDSTQLTYAGNLYYDHDRAGGWFNSATGYGALGYAIPAAIGAALADPGARVVAITGDGGAQFSLPEIMTAVDENLPVLFLVWNNRGYREIETAMIAAGVTVIGCAPTPPGFSDIAAACHIPYQACVPSSEALAAALENIPETGPCMIEITAPERPA